MEFDIKSQKQHKSRQKIFITKADSKLGFHLVQHLRDDHIHLNNHSYIVGSKSKSYKKSMHSALHGLVNYESQIALFGKTVLDCDVLILDLRQSLQENQFIVKLLESKAKQMQNGTDKNKNYMIVGIGSHMCWAHPKSYAINLQTQDKQHTLSKLLSYDPKRQQPISSQDRNKRINHHNWIRERQIQKSILALNKYKNMSSTIITTGLLYGKDMPSSQLQDLVAKCFNVEEEVLMYGEGNNILPTTYIGDLGEAVQFLIKNLRSEQNNKKCNKLLNNYIVVDEQTCTQKQIIQQLLKSSGFVKNINKLQLNYLSSIEALMSHSIHLKKSRQLPRSKINSFCKYFNQNFNEIYENIDLQITHYVIYAQQIQKQQLQQLKKKLETVIQVLGQDDLAGEICLNKNISRQQVDIHELSDHIQQKYLKQNHDRNYVLILNQILLDVNVCKKYQLKKYDMYQDSEHLLGHKFRLTGTQDNIEGKLNTNCQNSVTVNEQKNNKSKTQAQNILQKQQNKENQNDQQRQKANKIKEKEDILSRQQIKKYSRIDQYLFDNVICYISQAMLKTGPNPELPNFIDALKSIYQRESNLINEQI